MPFNGNIKAGPTGTGLLYVPDNPGVPLMVAVMGDKDGNVIAASDNGNGTSNVIAVEVGIPAVTLYQETLTLRTANGAADTIVSSIRTSQLRSLLLGINVSALSSGAGLTVTLSQQDANQVWQQVIASGPITAAGASSLSVGYSTHNPVMLNGGPYQLAWTLTGTSPQVTFQMSLQGR